MPDSPAPRRPDIRHHDVFISYAQNDKPIADAICAKLELRKIRCWIAPRDVPPATDFPAAIVDGIDGSEFLVLVFSSHANNSPHVIRELTSAVNKGRIIVPFRIEDVMPSKSMEYLISVPHWLDAITPPLEKHIDALADTMEQLLATTGRNVACPACKTPLSAQAKFCKSCGTPIPEKTPRQDLLENGKPERPGQPVPARSPTAQPSFRAARNSLRKLLIVTGIAAAALVILLVLLSATSPTMPNPLAAITGKTEITTIPTPVVTLPVDYRSGEAFVNQVALTTEPTQVLPRGTELSVETSKDPTNAVVTVQFVGGPGLGLVRDNTVVLTRSDGTATSGKLDFNTKLSEIALQGTRGTDRLQVIVTMKSGITYTVIDKLIPYRVRGST